MDSSSPEAPGSAEAGPERASNTTPEEPAHVGSKEPVFHLDVSRSEPKHDYVRLGAGLAAAMAVISIVVFSVTGLSERLVPWEDRYWQVLIPKTEDGSEPFVLNELSHGSSGNAISVSGQMTNMSLEEVENVIAVITVEDTTRREPARLEVPVSPSLLSPEDIGEFSTSVTLRARPTGYSVSFRLQDGPDVPHRDGRASAFQIVIP